MLLRASVCEDIPVSTLKCLPYLYRSGSVEAPDSEAVTEAIKGIASRNVLQMTTEHYPSFRNLALSAPTARDGAVRCTSFLLALRHGLYAARIGYDPADVGVGPYAANPASEGDDPLFDV